MNTVLTLTLFLACVLGLTEARYRKSRQLSNNGLLPEPTNICLPGSRYRAGHCPPVSLYVGYFNQYDMEELSEMIRTFENENIRCENTQIQLQTLNISQFVELPPLPTNLQNTVTKGYMKMSQLEYLLHALVSSKADQCCLSANSFYHRFRHRIMTKWRQLQQCYGCQIPSENCVVSETIAEDIDCDDLRDFMYVLLLHLRTEMREAVYELNCSK